MYIIHCIKYTYILYQYVCITAFANLSCLNGNSVVVILKADDLQRLHEHLLLLLLLLFHGKVLDLLDLDHLVADADQELSHHHHII